MASPRRGAMVRHGAGTRHRSRRHQDRDHRTGSFRRRAAAPAAGKPARRLPEDPGCGRGAGRRDRGGAGRARHRGLRHAGRDLAGHRAYEELELDLAERPAARSRSRRSPGAADRDRQRCRLLRALGGHRWRRRRRRVHLRRDHRHRHRRRARDPRPPAGGPERDRRRVGPQSLALAAPGRAAGPELLLRPAGLSRDLDLGTRPRARPSPADRRSTGAACDPSRRT